MQQHRKVLDQAAQEARRLVLMYRGAFRNNTVSADEVVQRFRHQLLVDLADGACPCCGSSSAWLDLSCGLWVHEVNGLIVPCEKENPGVLWGNEPCPGGTVDLSSTVQQGYDQGRRAIPSTHSRPGSTKPSRDHNERPN